VNILLLGINFNNWGGIESYSDVLASILLKKGHKVVVTGMTDNGFFTLRSSGETLKIPRMKIKTSIDISAILKIIKLTVRENVNLIIAQQGKHYFPALLAAKICGVPVIFVRHQTRRLKSSTCWLINRWCHAVIAVSDAVKSSLITSGVSNGKIKVIHNCVPLNRFDPLKVDAYAMRKELGINPADVVVGAPGKLHRDKGVFELLYSIACLAKRYPFLKVLFVGGGPARNCLDAEAQRLFIQDKVVFAGVRTDMERVYAAMDICVLPSKCVEGFGMVLIEAMAMKKPVIGSAIGGIKEIITDSVNGLLVPPADVGALSDAIARYIEDRKFSEKMAIEGRRTVESRFSDETHVKSFENRLKELKSGVRRHP